MIAFLFVSRFMYNNYNDDDGNASMCTFHFLTLKWVQPSFWGQTKSFDRKNKCEVKCFLHIKGPMPKGTEQFHRSK